MTLFKKQLLAILLLIAGPAISFASLSYSLMVELKDGTAHEYRMDEKPKVSFTDSSVLVSSSEMNAEYQKEDFQKFYFESTNNPTEVEEIIDNDKELLSIKFIDANTISISYNMPDAIAYLFSVDGKCITSTALNEGKALISLRNCPSGIYIVSINNQTVKIYKK